MNNYASSVISKSRLGKSIFILALLSFTPASSKANGQAPERASIQVLDDTGQNVTLSRPAQRIVTLAPHATEMLLAIGAADRLLAVAQFFDYPAAIDHLPRLNTAGRLDRERLLQLEPDLVIGWASGNQPGDIRWLQRSGIPVYLSEPASLDATAANLVDLGLLTGRADQAGRAARRFRQRLTSACPGRHPTPLDKCATSGPERTGCTRKERNRSWQEQTAYYEIWPSPAITIGGHHWLNEVLALASLRNVFDDVPRGIFTVSAESRLARPVSIIISSQPQGSTDNPHTRTILADATLGRPGPRLIEGLERLCKSLNTVPQSRHDKAM